MGAIVFVTGGARSGKSRFAEQRATESGRPVVYVATMEANDDELDARIERHRERRPTEWHTIEAPVDVRSALERCPDGATILLDCLSLWVSNRLFATGATKRPVPEWERFVDDTVAAASDIVAVQGSRGGELIIVSNEVGLGIVPGDPLSRWYRDALGLVNQTFAQAATEAWLLVSGLPVRLK